jgi:hypothetical protein
MPACPVPPCPTGYAALQQAFFQAQVQQQQQQAGAGGQMPNMGALLAQRFGVLPQG